LAVVCHDSWRARSKTCSGSGLKWKTQAHKFFSNSFNDDSA